MDDFVGVRWLRRVKWTTLGWVAWWREGRWLKHAARLALRIGLLRPAARLSRKLAMRIHRAQHVAEWEVGEPPEWYDHSLDVYWQWPARGSFFFLERGVFGALVLRPTDAVLDLCCGDGFNSSRFYAHLAGEVVGVDFDPAAIRHASSINDAPNVRFELCDIRESLPAGPHDVVFWDAAIEHFTVAEIDAVLRNIKARLQPGGVLSGYTLVAKGGGEKHLVHHEHEFADKEELARMLRGFFSFVSVFDTIHPERHNLYFWASDERERLPFQAGNPRYLWAGNEPDGPR